MPLSMAERFVKHEEDFKKGKPVIVGADINFFAELAGGYEEQMSCVVKKLGTFMGNEDNAAEVLIAINCYDGAQHGITEKSYAMSHPTAPQLCRQLQWENNIRQVTRPQF